MSFIVSLPLERYPANACDRLDDPHGMARAAAWLAQLAYEEDIAKVDAVAGRWGLSRLATLRGETGAFRLPGPRGYVFAGHGRRLACFCGTDPLVASHWLIDLSIVQNADGVHRGFAEALVSVAPQAEAVLGGAEPVICLGHSLGAALAVLFAARRVAAGAEVAAVHALGMPRAGNGAFAARYEAVLGARTLRLVHGRDIVPTLPPSGLGYRHVGRRLACRRNTTFDVTTVDAGPSDAPRFAASTFQEAAAGLAGILSGAPPMQPAGWLAAAARLLLPSGILDHLPDRYCAALDG